MALVAGLQDWGWFYPFHYAPCASDLVQLGDFVGGQFEIGQPFTPFQQVRHTTDRVRIEYASPAPTVARAWPRRVV